MLVPHPSMKMHWIFLKINHQSIIIFTKSFYWSPKIASRMQLDGGKLLQVDISPRFFCLNLALGGEILHTILDSSHSHKHLFIWLTWTYVPNYNSLKQRRDTVCIHGIPALSHILPKHDKSYTPSRCVIYIQKATYVEMQLTRGLWKWFSEFLCCNMTILLFKMKILTLFKIIFQY